MTRGKAKSVEPWVITDHDGNVLERFLFYGTAQHVLASGKYGLNSTVEYQPEA